MTDDERDTTCSQRPFLIHTPWLQIDADGSPSPARPHSSRSFSMSPELEMLCAWLDAG